MRSSRLGCAALVAAVATPVPAAAANDPATQLDAHVSVHADKSGRAES